MTVQEALAPFVLENVNCTGSESRLVDCPVATGVGLELIDYGADTGDYSYEYMQYKPEFCDFRKGGTFTFIACGATSGPGVVYVPAADARPAAGTGHLTAPTLHAPNLSKDSA